MLAFEAFRPWFSCLPQVLLQEHVREREKLRSETETLLGVTFEAAAAQA